MNKMKWLSRIIAAILIVCVIFSGHGLTMLARAAEKDKELDELYIKEVKVFYGYNEEHARKACEAEGFTFCPEDLKQGTASHAKAYLGYKTTKDEGDAITDLTLLDMKDSHFEEMPYSQYLDEHIGEYANAASQIMVLVNEFRRLYKQGNPNALAAYDSLNMLYVDKDRKHNLEDNLLGKYIVEKADVTFFEKYMQRGNTQILSAMINQLSFASASGLNEDGTNWVDASGQNNIIEEYEEADSARRNEIDTWYLDPARNMINAVQMFADDYNTAVKLREKYGDTFGYDKTGGLTEDTELVDVMEDSQDCKLPEYVGALVTYDFLDKVEYPEKGHTLAEYFLELGSDPNLGDHPEALYPMIASMSAAQRTALNFTGLNMLARGLYQVEDYEQNRSKLIKESQEQLKEQGFEDGKMWLWEAVDQTIYNQKIAQTSDKIEAERASDIILNSTNEAARKAASNVTIGLQIADIFLLAIPGIFMITQVIIGGSVLAWGCAAVYGALSAFFMGVWFGWAVANLLLGAFVCVLWVLNVAAFIAGLVIMMWMLLDWMGAFETHTRADYDAIPTILFHVRKNQDGEYGVRYDAVKSNGNGEKLFEIKQYYYYDDRSTEAERIAEVEDDVQERREWVEKRKTDHSPGAGQGPKGYKDAKDDLYLVNNYGQDRVGNANTADMGGYQAEDDRWMALFYSKAPACGKPIKVIEGQSLIRLQKEDYHVPAGCKAVSLIGGSQAADINSMDIYGKPRTPLYMFIVKDPNAKDDPETKQETETKSDGQYITRVRLVHNDDRSLAINQLKKDGFTDIIDTNLTPYSGYTFIGYQKGSKSGALTDLRVSSQGIDPILFGNASYAKLGTGNTGSTPDGWSIYGTSSPEAGTPITKISIENKRLDLGSGAEPVCLFSGGQAVDFKHKWSDNYDYSPANYVETGLFSVDYHHVKVRQDDPKEGGLYIYFWPEEQYKAPEKDSKAPYVSGFSYFLSINDNEDTRYGSQSEYMAKFAKENGFELVYDGDKPQKMMSDEAAKMSPIANWKDKEGGALGHDWLYDMYHYMTYGYAFNLSDKGIGSSANLKDQIEEGTKQTTMYFGVSYTYNPYRAVTGIAGLITPYTETTKSLRFTGLTTPAGCMQLCNTSIQGNPVTQPGIAYGYYGYTNMNCSLYPNSTARQKSEISWLKGGETEILSHNLLTSGASKGRAPIKRDDLAFVSKDNPGQLKGYAPLCDLRTPGDYDHPMNLALDTTNLGSQYLYMYLKNDAGGRVSTDADGNAIKEEGSFNQYQKKHYVAGVFCGTGKTPEEALNNLYSKAKTNWLVLSKQFPDISETPLVTEFDEVIPYDMSDQTPWYQCYCRDVGPRDPENDEWVRGNDAANLRWGHENSTTNYGAGYKYFLAPDEDDTADNIEKTRDYAYIGVVRTAYTQGTATITKKADDGSEKTTTQTVYPVYTLLKYYTDSSAPETLSVAEVSCNQAGGPIRSKEGTYYLYYSTNKATASFSAPVTEIDVSGEAFINGYNTSYSVKESDRVNHVLPTYNKLRMRTDEFKYIHTKFDMQDLPYIERIFIGVGNNKKEAYADLISSTTASAATSVNCNYNSYSDKWIAIGYRRTAAANKAVNDLFLYSGDNPPNEIKIDSYPITETSKGGKTTSTVKAGKITYTLIKHSLKSGSEVISLNEGSGGKGLYLYYAAKRQALENSVDTEIYPINNIAFGYGDTSPSHATAEDLAAVYGETVHGRKNFDISDYQDPVWEFVLGMTETPDKYKLDGSMGTPMSLNYGQLPLRGNSKAHANGDTRVMMYVDRGNSIGPYTPRTNAALTSAGYYSATSKVGRLTQDK